MSVEETRTTRVTSDEPRVIHTHTTEVQSDNGSAAAWWIGAIVAIVAILAVVFLVTRTPDQSSLDNAVEQGRLSGALEASQQGLSNATQAAENAADRAADAAASAADRAVPAPANPPSITINNPPPAEPAPVG